MRLAKFLAAAACATLATAPVLAAPTSLAQVRASTQGEDSSELRPAILIGLLATVAVVGGAVILANSDESPDSP